MIILSTEQLFPFLYQTEKLFYFLSKTEIKMKNRKSLFYTESAYLLGLIALAIGTALMEKADLGMSMVVAPAYLLHLKLSQYWSFFTFGMAEYLLQFFLVILLAAVLRRFRLSYLISFATALIYGLLLDLSIAAFAAIYPGSLLFRILLYLVGMILCTFGIALLFHAYIAPEAYELFVKEVSARYSLPIHKVKTVYDCVSCAIAILMSFLFFGFGQFEGIKWGTVFCTLVNGWLIGRWTALFDRRFTFSDGLPLRKYLS